MGAIAEQNKIESETQAYKLFMKVAKKLRYLEYGKWQIVPDINEPLRKFTIEKDFEWAKVKLMLYSHQYRKRNYDYGNWENAYAWRYEIGAQGLFRNSNGDIVCKSGLLLKPRMAKKLLSFVNTQLIPHFYLEVENTRKEHDEAIETTRIFKENMKKLHGIVKMTPRKYDSSRYEATIPNDSTKWNGVSTHSIVLDKDSVSITLDVNYDTAKKVLEALRG